MSRTTTERTHCFLDISIGGRPAGRILVALYDDTVPRTANNFARLCAGDAGVGKTTGKPLAYKGTIFHRIIPGFMCQGGDFSARNGTGGESIYGAKFADESFSMKHSRPYLLSMANAGPNTNGSQFFITLVPTPHLNGKHVVFGEVIHGVDVVRKMEAVDSTSDRPVSGQEVMISDCGIVDTKKSSESKQTGKQAGEKIDCDGDNDSASDASCTSSEDTEVQKKKSKKSKKSKTKHKKEKKEKKDRNDHREEKVAKEVERSKPGDGSGNDDFGRTGKNVPATAAKQCIPERNNCDDNEPSVVKKDSRGNEYRGRGVVKYRGAPADEYSSYRQNFRERGSIREREDSRDRHERSNQNRYRRSGEVDERTRGRGPERNDHSRSRSREDRRRTRDSPRSRGGESPENDTQRHASNGSTAERSSNGNRSRSRSGELLAHRRRS
jgi:peptidyl-prolyl isomerase G (cyclophilin G)